MNKDAVSRNEVIKMIHNHAFDYATSKKISALLKTMRGEVERMLPVQKINCNTCKHYGVFSLECARCDDKCSQYEESEDK